MNGPGIWRRGRCGGLMKHGPAAAVHDIGDGADGVVFATT